MSDGVLVALIGGGFAILNTVLMALILSRIEKVHKATNSLVDIAILAARARGVLEGLNQSTEYKKEISQ
jgi:hypothetical protein